MNLPPLDDTVASNQNQLTTISRTLRLSEGEFSLLLARCNYASLRQKIVTQLHQQSPVPIRELQLSPSTQNLYRTIEAQLQQEQPSMLMVFGLDQVAAIDQVLGAANLAREAFLNFPFPLLLWIDDKLWKKFNRIAPDFTGYATTYVFNQTSQELVHFLHSKAQQLVTTVLEIGGSSFVSNSKILGGNSTSELQAAYQDLQQREITINPSLEARLRFVLGRHYYAHQQISEALEQYELSLKFWQQQENQAEDPNSHLLDQTSVPLQVWQGLLQFHLGLCYALRAEQHLQHSGQTEWQQARQSLEQCLQQFEAAQRQDLVAQFINQLGEVLRQLQDWDALHPLALKSRELHKTATSHPVQLAQDYGFLAEVALHRAEWENAKELATVALEILDQATGTTLDPVNNQHKGVYLWLLAQALGNLGLPTEAIENLERAELETIPKYNPKFYLKILAALRQFYFDLGNYKKAFDIKNKYRVKSSAFGYTAFIGAGRLQPREQAIDPVLGMVSTAATVTDEIKASGREEAINQLLGRVASTQHKLTVIYGQSGVGKSSILRAGLVPALKSYSVEARQVVPVLLRTYNSYARELERHIFRNLQEDYSSSESLETETNGQVEALSLGDSKTRQDSLEKILNRLRLNPETNQVTVLILDQFEEFFLVVKTPKSRRIFFSFLRECLNLPYVKVMLSIRDDYLHYLLECVRLIELEIINNDILSKDILFYLGNFSCKEAYNVIKSLTEQSHFYLEDRLIQDLVKDLSSDLGEVRPIELQLVGAQLQAENITTWAEYQQKGPKQKLVERFLEQAIQDCGSDNEPVANLILYLLTDENNTRPLKTRSELVEELEDELHASANLNQQINIVLYILERSGLIAREVIDGSELYQLVHDYLADFIHQKHQSDRDEEFEILQQKNKELQEDLDISSQLAKETERRRRAESRSRTLERIMVLLLGVFFSGLALMAFWQKKQGEQATIEAIQTAKLFVSDLNQLQLLQTIIQLRQRLQITSASEQVKNEMAQEFRPLFSDIQEQNILAGHQDFILTVDWSPNGKTIVTAGNDQTIKLWQPDGTLIKSFKDSSLSSENEGSHQGNITRVSFSPDGNTIASSSVDQTIKLWSRDGKLLHTLNSHDDVVMSVSFSPDGKVIASASLDGVIKLWNPVTGKETKTIKAHTNGVSDVEFSPDGKTLVSGGVSDKTVKLWKRDGKPLKTLKGHCESVKTQDCIVYDVTFSPDGQNVASASSDSTIKLWNFKTGKEITTLKGHNSDVFSVSFSPDGQTLTSSSSDRTVKLWNPDGVLLRSLTGHQKDVRAVSFSPDSQMIASASTDNTVKLWARNRNPLDQVLLGHTEPVNHVSVSPDGEIVATASDDKTVRLWNAPEGLPRLTQENQPIVLQHSDLVKRVSFSPDGKTIATASRDQTIKLWTLEGELLQTLKGHQAEVWAVNFSPDGEMIASASSDKTVKLWQADGTLLQTLELQSPAFDVQFNSTGTRLAAAITEGSSDQKTGSVQLWDLNSQETSWQSILTLLYKKQTVSQINFVPQSDVVVIASDKNVQLWSPTKRRSCPLPHQATVRSVSTHPNGEIIATASDDKTVRLWKLSERQLWPTNEEDCASVKMEPFYTINQDVYVNSIQFSQDGTHLAIAQEDGGVILWNMQGLELDYQVRRSCAWLEDYLETNVNVKPEDQVMCEIE